MDWLHRMKKAWVAVSTRIRTRGGVSGGGGASTGDDGLLKLRDDVQMCGYKDVQVMWKMLSGSQQEQMAAAETTVTTTQPLKRIKQRQLSWRVLFWTNNRRP
uniref:Uncharacterized protein n=1 Tax=Fagus sylvatica TaxID=28930 RepID=A0A2N9ILF9_FAGSY